MAEAYKRPARTRSSPSRMAHHGPPPLSRTCLWPSGTRSQPQSRTYYSMNSGNCEIQTTRLQHLLWYMFYFPPNCDPWNTTREIQLNTSLPKTRIMYSRAPVRRLKLTMSPTTDFILLFIHMHFFYIISHLHSIPLSLFTISSCKCNPLTFPLSL